MYTNRFIPILVTVALAAVAVLTFREAIASNVQAEAANNTRINQEAEAARWIAMGQFYKNIEEAERRRDQEAQPYIMDSATRSYIAWGQAMQVRNTIDSGTRSYIAWGEALEAAGKLGNLGACSNTTQENIFDGIDSNLDSATRSYIAWGLALQAKDDLCR